MKKITLCLLATSLSLTFYPFQSNAATIVPASSLVVSKPVESAEAKVLLRLNEIKAMDKSTLSRSEKKALRKEVLAIDKNLYEHQGGVYISVGGLIIIILLLIIIF